MADDLHHPHRQFVPLQHVMPSKTHDAVDIQIRLVARIHMLPVERGYLCPGYAGLDGARLSRQLSAVPDQGHDPSHWLAGLWYGKADLTGHPSHGR